eukprot:TRINITY_DN422_c0_g1_i1.p1 TRINITY_DN422_c0_g1~~TRINITY_DN422_c0_g1_i1.p1  ORF type:complete len:597 (+),score=156.88 TRINITY_DN422_c0_g1_i1:67-1857(+)
MFKSLRTMRSCQKALSSSVPPPPDNWMMRWSGGRRVFYNQNNPTIAYGEQWYPNNTSEAYYFKLGKGDEAIGNGVGANEVPFKADQVSLWKLVEGGFKYKANGEFWSRHFDEHENPFYVSADGSRREWDPVPPAPPRRVTPSGRAGWNNRRDQATPMITETSPMLAITESHAHPHRRNDRIVIEPNVNEKNFHAAPISPGVSFPIGTHVCLIDDYALLADKITNHPGIFIESKSPHALRRYRQSMRRRFYLDAWTKKETASAGAEGVMVRIKPVEKRNRKPDPNRRPNVDTFWVPSSCIRLAHELNECSVPTCNFYAEDPEELRKHMLSHKNFVSCKTCHHVSHITQAGAHAAACNLLPERDLLIAEQRKLLIGESKPTQKSPKKKHKKKTAKTETDGEKPEEKQEEKAVEKDEKDVEEKDKKDVEKKDEKDAEKKDEKDAGEKDEKDVEKKDEKDVEQKEEKDEASKVEKDETPEKKAEEEKPEEKQEKQNVEKDVAKDEKDVEKKDEKDVEQKEEKDEASKVEKDETPEKKAEEEKPEEKQEKQNVEKDVAKDEKDVEKKDEAKDEKDVEKKDEAKEEKTKPKKGKKVKGEKAE